MFAGYRFAILGGRSICLDVRSATHNCGSCRCCEPERTTFIVHPLSVSSAAWSDGFVCTQTGTGVVRV